MLAQHGGHCAFLTDDWEENNKGWLATELSRFGEHVDRLGRLALPAAAPAPATDPNDFGCK